MKTLETSSGPKTFTVTQFAAMRSMKMLARLGKILGPLAADPDNAARALFTNLGEEDFERLLRDLFDGVMLEWEGKQIPLMPVFDRIFQGQPGEVLKLLVFVLQVNYGSFFKGIGGLDPQALLKKFAGSTISSGPASASSSEASPPSKS
jgi:hypothetical protein